MKFTLSIDCGNAAFADNGVHVEVARMLDRLSGRVGADQGQEPLACGKYILRDSNGNKVGVAVFVPDTP